MDHEEALRALQAVCTRDLLHRDYQGSDQSTHALNGYCYGLTQAMYCLFPDDFMPHRIDWNGNGSHWYLVHKRTGGVFDTIAINPAQRATVCLPHEYQRGTPKNYRNPLPELKAKALLARADMMSLLKFPIPQPAVALFRIHNGTASHSTVKHVA